MNNSHIEVPGPDANWWTEVNEFALTTTPIPEAVTSTPWRELVRRSAKIGIGTRRSPLILKFAERHSSSSRDAFDTLTRSLLVTTIATSDQSSCKYVT